MTGLMAMLEEDYGVELSMLSSGVTILYSDFMDRKKMQVGPRKGVKGVCDLKLWVTCVGGVLVRERCVRQR